MVRRVRRKVSAWLVTKSHAVVNGWGSGLAVARVIGEERAAVRVAGTGRWAVTVAWSCTRACVSHTHV